MRKINKKEINILLTNKQHDIIALLKETGINMSSLSRLAIRKYSDTELIETDDGPKTKRAVIYLEYADYDMLRAIAMREKINRSEALRRLLAKYLSDNEDALRKLFFH